MNHRRMKPRSLVKNVEVKVFCSSDKKRGCFLGLWYCGVGELLSIMRIYVFSYVYSPEN